MSLSSGFEGFEMECGWLCVGTVSMSLVHVEVAMLFIVMNYMLRIHC